MRSERKEKMDEKMVKVWPTVDDPRCYGMRRKKSKSLNLHGFLKQNPEIIIKLMAIICAVLVFATWAVTKHKVTETLREKHQEELSAMRVKTEQETISWVKAEYGINDANLAKTERERKARIIGDALVPYEEAGNSDEALYMIAFSMLNREFSPRYPDKIEEVVHQAEQYMGASDENKATDRCYRIALDAVTIFETTGAPMGRNYVYVNWSTREVKLLDNLEIGQATHTYYETDMRDFLKARESNG